MSVDRRPKPCTCPRADHQHGERATFKICGCRCYPCSTANSSYTTQRDRNQLYGRPTTAWVDAGPVRAHLAKLSEAGMGRRTIARTADVTESTISRVLYGRNGSPPSVRCNPAFSAAVLVVEIPTATELADHAVVDSTGTRRRLQALARIGWSVNRLAEAGSIDRQRLDRALAGHQVFAETAKAVAELYARLQSNPPTPTDDWRDRSGINRTVRQATAAGWPPPIAWDDDAIDNPDATPELDEDLVDDDAAVDDFVIELVLDGQPMNVHGRDLEVAALQLSDRGLDYAAIAARCRSDETTVRRVLNTARQRASRAAAKGAVA